MRPVTDADLDAVVHLVDEADRALGLEADPLREYLTWIWHLPSTDLARDTRLVVDGARPICYAQATWSSEEGGPLEASIRVHPEHVGRGLGSWALAWAEASAAERGADGVRARVADRDEAAHALLTSRGYVKVRSSWTMGRTLDPGEEPGAAPPGVTIRGFQEGRDEHVMHEAHEAAFAEHWGFRPVPYEVFEAQMYAADAWDPSLTCLAEADGQVVGHVMALSFEGESDIAILGVVPGWRGRGVAKALLRRAFAELADRGHREVRLSVDAQNPTGAVALYESVGMTPLRSYDAYDLGTADADGVLMG